MLSFQLHAQLVLERSTPALYTSPIFCICTYYIVWSCRCVHIGSIPTSTISLLSFPYHTSLSIHALHTCAHRSTWLLVQRQANHAATLSLSTRRRETCMVSRITYLTRYLLVVPSFFFAGRNLVYTLPVTGGIITYTPVFSQP